MARKVKNKTVASNNPETDSAYFLKIVMFFIIGSIWFKFLNFEFLPSLNVLPVGLLIGLVFATHDHFQIDRKIEYAILLAAAIVSFVAPIGIIIEI